MKELNAREGYYLTQVEDVEDRIFITSIKGMNVNEEDWREATEKEKENYLKLQEQAIEKDVIQ